MKYLVLSMMIMSSVYALPIKTGEHFRTAIPGEFIVKTAGEKIAQNVKRVLGKNLYLLKDTTQKSLAKYKYAYPNYQYFGDYKDVESNRPNDINFEKQFHHQMVKTTVAWNTTSGDEKIIVAVTDNEFQIDHKDLESSWWKNQDEIANNGIDDDGNGYIDDVVGWDFFNNDNNVVDPTQSTHGTHVSGIIAATANNKSGGVGVAPGVKVMPLKWYGEDGSWTSAIISETYHYAVDNGAKIITTSYNVDGFVDDQAYLAAIKYIRSHDVIIFNSAGNAGQKNPPRQKIKELVLVCSVKSGNEKKQDKKSSFSNYGTGIDICAPGDPVYAPIKWSTGTQDHYGELSGTSMAAPVAAAVAALIWSAHPNFTDEEVIQKLYDSADNIDKRNFWYKKKLGAGRVNAAKAVL
ncbi:MAG: S8 family serine peptidase [Halobacteriovoraceae bacterium]|jgi:subtilisin family serine protease|nr:S8 family serine peptidase [Halobacteriovoraceae bacterium]